MATSAQVQTAFAEKFATGKLASYRPSDHVALEGKNYTQKLNDDDDNEAVAVLTEHRSATAHIATEVRQKGSGRIAVKLDFAADTPEEFAAILKMVKDGVAAVDTYASSENWRDNNLPTLTTITTLGAVDLEEEVEFTKAEIAAVANEADSGGSVVGFVVQEVLVGSLKIGADAESATDFEAGVNDTIDADNNAYYTAPDEGTGATNAFTVKAKDNEGWLSATAVNVPVTLPTP